MSFIYLLGQRVAIVESGECGTVIARAQYERNEDRYLVRYKAADGRATEAWWQESAITYAVGSVPPPFAPMAGVEVKAADVTRRTLAMVDTGGGGGIEAPSASDRVQF
jgi:hypothetical protein